MKGYAIFGLFCVGVSLPFFASCSSNNTPIIHTHQKGELKQICTFEYDIPFPAKYTCKDCGEIYMDSITPQEINMPIVNIVGCLDDIGKYNPINASIEYTDPLNKYNFKSNIEIKLQGAIALHFPKKNYNVTFYNDDFSKKQKIKLNDEWDAINKITLKGNYNDALRCHNNVGSDIVGDVVHSRPSTSPTHKHLSKLINGGAIDGYPVGLYNNGNFLGLFTLNLPKNKILFDMGKYDDTDEQAVMLCSNVAVDSTRFLAPITGEDFDKDYWSVEYCSTGEDEYSQYKWAVESMNEFINFVLDPENDGDSSTWDPDVFKQHLGDYVEIDRLIDYYITMDFLALTDGVAKNILWVKYPDTKWFPSAYDLDFCGGFSLAPLTPTTLSYQILDPKTTVNIMTSNNLWDKLERDDTFFETIKSRYHELRNSNGSSTGPFDLDNIYEKLDHFYNQFNPLFLEADFTKYKMTPLLEKNTLDAFKSFMQARAKYFDEEKYLI